MLVTICVAFVLSVACYNEEAETVPVPLLSHAPELTPAPEPPPEQIQKLEPETTPELEPETEPLFHPPQNEYEILSFGGFDWLVLDVLDDRMLILSEGILESRAYHNTFEDITWEHSDIRKYLNDDFFNSFSATDRARISETMISNHDNPWTFSNWGISGNTPGGNYTTDRVFLLSIDEIIHHFGDSGMLEIGIDENARDENLVHPSRGRYGWGIHDQYSSKRVAYHVGGTYGWEWNSNIETITIENGEPSWWWLRSPGSNSYRAASVSPVGYVYFYGFHVYLANSGIRPALWLNIDDT